MFKFSYFRLQGHLLENEDKQNMYRLDWDVQFFQK